MKKNITKSVLFAFSIATLVSCDTLQQIASSTVAGTNTGNTPGLSNGDVISGLKEALNVGITNSVNIASLTDGFLSNSNIRLPFPQDALVVREKAIEWGLAGQVEKFETTLRKVILIINSSAQGENPYTVDVESESSCAGNCSSCSGC